MLSAKLGKNLLLTMVGLFGSYGAGAEEPVQEDFKFSSSFDGTGPLNARAVYPKDAARLPIMVVQHGYGGNRKSVAYSASRIAQKGFFCVCIDTRGNGGSAGTQDDGGIEIMDIYDGIQAAIQKYDSKVDRTNISMVGYSNGGGNVFFSTVRFPYLFRATMSFFGIPDYGMWNANGNTYGVTKFVGGTVKELPDKYMVRNSILAVGNLSGTHFHMAYDEKEGICPVRMQEAFVAAVNKINYPHLTVHVSREGDAHRWKHGYNTGHLNDAEDAFAEDVLKKTSSLVAMPAGGELVVLGFIVTPRFTIFLGKGDDAAAKVRYEFNGDTARFSWTPMTSDPQAKTVLTLSREASEKIKTVFVNGKETAFNRKDNLLRVESTFGATR